MDTREKLVELLTEFYGCDPMYYNVDALAIADHLVSNGVTQGWVSVKDRLPEDGDIVLCYMEFGEQRIAQWDESENCWAGQLIDYHKEQVTHWMPLPTQPKGE